MCQILKRALLFQFLLLCILFTSAQYQYIGGYDGGGRPNYLVTPGDTIGVAFRNKIAANLPEWRSVPVYNPSIISPVKTETLNLRCTSDVWITFVDEGASYWNALGYYTYNTSNPPVTAPPANQIKIIFPNASKSGFGGDLKAGDKVYLGNFPANTGIGFVLIADGWNRSVVTPGKWTLYSNSAFNPEQNPLLKKHTVILKDSYTNRFVIGFEDRRRDSAICDHDFNDLLFIATLNPMNCADKTDSIPDLIDDGDTSHSGNTGGLESKSLGDKIASRIYHKVLAGTNGDVDYKKMPLLRNENRTIRSTAVTSGISLEAVMPTQIPDSGYTAYVTTPADITSLTNASEVRSVDFTRNGVCRAVTFATKTLGVMYDHTKAICDRLKGAELLNMENFSLNNLNFVRYTLKQENGSIEYSTSFSIGKKAGRNTFSFQSNWLNADYKTEDTLINYQVWGAAPYLSTDMTLEILDRLNKIMPVEQFTASAPLPKSYIINGSRDGAQLNLSIENKTSATSGYFEVEEKVSETSTIKTKRTIPFSMNANGKSGILFPMNDVFESTVSMFINGKLQDVVYMTDGIWNIGYDSTKTILKSFQVKNDSSRQLSDDYPVFRNVAVEATTSDFVSVYKVLRGAGAIQNLTAYKTLAFSAKGGTNLRIVLVKNSITNYADQYSYSMPLASELSAYKISLDDFKSAGTTDKINVNDITTVVFSFETTGGKSVTVNTLLNEVSFSKKTADYLNSQEAAQIYIFPNPVTGSSFTAAFRSTVNSTITVKLTEAASGKVIFTKNTNAVKGDNNIPVQLLTPATPSVYLLSITGTGVSLKTGKVIIQ